MTTVLAYVSFILAEEFHLSGVVATVAAGLTLSGWGNIKISPSVRAYLAFVAISLVFLMVGLLVDVAVLVLSGDLLFWVIIAMLLSRAVVIYGLMPIVARIPGFDPIDVRYQMVM